MKYKKLLSLILILVLFLTILSLSQDVYAIDVNSNVYYGSFNYIPNQKVNDLGETTFRVSFSYLDVNTDDPIWGKSVQDVMQNYSVNYGERDAIFSGGKSFYWFFYPNNLEPVNSSDYFPLGDFDFMRIIPNGLILYRNGNIYRSWTLTELQFMIGDNFTLHNITRDTGYQDGFNDGLDIGYSDGYDKAKNDYGYNSNGIIVSGENAYNLGKSAGIQESGNLKADIINFVPGVLGAIFMFFFQLGQIGILGITILDILGIIVLISGLIFLIKFFF